MRITSQELSRDQRNGLEQLLLQKAYLGTTVTEIEKSLGKPAGEVSWEGILIRCAVPQFRTQNETRWYYHGYQPVVTAEIPVLSPKEFVSAEVVQLALEFLKDLPEGRGAELAEIFVGVRQRGGKIESSRKLMNSLLKCHFVRFENGCYFHQFHTNAFLTALR